MGVSQAQQQFKHISLQRDTKQQIILIQFLVKLEISTQQNRPMDKQNWEKCASVLGIDTKQLNDKAAVKRAFRKKILDPSISGNREKRVQACKAYSLACSLTSQSKPSFLKQLIIEGNIPALENNISHNKECISEKINQYPPIYLAVRCGHYDVVQLFLKAGCSLDFKNDRSTPMHCAAYYGYHSIIPLLFMYGVPTNIKNVFGNLPIQQAASPQIQRLLSVSQGCQIKHLHEKLLDQGFGAAIINLKDKKTGKIVVKKLIHKNYFQYWNHLQYDDAYHGTHFDNLFSIMKNGLKMPGDKVEGNSLKVVPGHIRLGVQLNGYKDWSKAIFLSPSIYYSAHPVYSKEFIDSEEVWLPLLQVKVKKGSYTRHDHTLGAYDMKNSQPNRLEFRLGCQSAEGDSLAQEVSKQPTALEFRVTCCDDSKDLIIRSEKTESVVVVASLIIKKGFLDDHDNYKETSQFLLHSEEEKHFRRHNVKC